MSLKGRVTLLSAVSLGCLLTAAQANARELPGDQPARADSAIAAPDAAAVPAQTGTDTPPETDDIVVVGIRASLAAALEAKRLAPNVVDSISAEEAGKFPDNNLAESLQRLPGVAVVRGFGAGQQISVRGLGPDFTNVLLNGRSLPSDTGAWSADGGGRGRSFNFDVLPSEMISRVDINKTSLPELTEGGIGATVNIITPRPLASGKTYGSLSVAGNVSSRINAVRPKISGILSWVNKDATFGVTATASYNDLRASGDYARVGQWDQGPFNVITGDANNPVVKRQTLVAPRQMSFGTYSGGTKRYFGSLTAQFKPTDTLLLTADGMYSYLKQNITDSILNPSFGNTVLNPTLSSEGILLSGTYPGQAFLNSPNVAAALAALYAGQPRVDIAQPQNLGVIRERNRTARNYAAGFNALWNATSNLDIEGDLSYARSKGKKPSDPYILVGNYARNNVSYDLNGGNPVVQTSDPVFTDPSQVRLGYAGNWRQDIVDTVKEARLTARWRSDGGILKGLEGGGDYQDHKKGLKDFGSDRDYGLTGAVNPGLLRPVGLDNDFLKGLISPPTNSFFGYDVDQMMASLAGGPIVAQYNQGGSFDTREKVAAGYVDTKWGGSRWSANIGVRVVHVDTKSSGWGDTVTNISQGSSGDPIFTRSTAGPLAESASYTSVLPSGNLKFNVTDRVALRLAASRTLTRADLNDLRYGRSWGGPYNNLSLDLGNPGLKPQYANNYDVSLEWYISRINYISVAGFRKDLSNLFQKRTLNNEVMTVGGQTYNVDVTQTINLSKGHVQGVEVTGQYALDDRFGWASGFGVSGNYTHLSSKTSGANSCGFTGLSPNSYNVSGFFDNGKISTRLSYNWRSTWITSCQWDGKVINGKDLQQKHDSYGQLDLSFRVNLTERLQIFADATNLTNANNYLYGDNTDLFIQRSVDYRRYDFGARIAF